MGGAGTWHIGLHHPSDFCVIGPGAGFTETHGYVGNLPKELPDYQEKCLRIYDAVDYAENAFNVPVVAYSGEKDAQKKAADNIENALKGFKEPHKFTHLVAPGLEHQMPKDWQEKAETEYRKYADKGRPQVSRTGVRFVTYTTRWHDFGHGDIEALERHYEKALIDSHWTKDALQITTQNVAAVRLIPDEHPVRRERSRSTAEGSRETGTSRRRLVFLVKTERKWSVARHSISLAGRGAETPGTCRGRSTMRSCRRSKL